MNRLCVFAHWDKDNIIDDYVVYYLQKLSSVCTTIIFVSDCPELENLEVLDGIVDFSLIKKHGEYDFGSYKRGFLFANEKGIIFDELLFANDSCYGPFYSLENIFTKMDKKKCDYWGLTQNSYGVEKRGNIEVAIWSPHIQSYFLNFKKQVFESNIFNKFINSIKREDNKNIIITKYEVGLSKLLQNNGFKGSVYINKYHHTENCLSIKWKRLIKWHKFPFIKTSVIKNGLFVTGEIKDWKTTIQSVSDYPVEMITKNSKRLQNFNENLYKDFNTYRKIRYKVLNNCPMEFRYILIKIEKNLFNFFNRLCFNKLKKF